MQRAGSRGERGFTLLEIVLVTALVVGLLSIMVYNFGPFREGQNVAICKTNITKVQQAMRSFAMLNNIADGGALASTDIIGANKMLAATPVCKSAGTYTMLAVVPVIGTAYCTDSIADHNPAGSDIQ